MASLAREQALLNKISLLKILYRPKHIKIIADRIQSDQEIDPAIIEQMMNFDQDKEVKRVVHPGQGRTGLMRVGKYLINGAGEVVAEPPELKRQIYGVGQVKLKINSAKLQCPQTKL